jgi:hypothetical protein
MTRDIWHAPPEAPIRLINADMADVLPGLGCTVIVTDPVWPNAIVPLPGSDDPYGLFAKMVDAMPATVRRAAITLGCDSDPGMLAPMQKRLPFFRACVMEYVKPVYKGRLLYGFDLAYFFGEPPKGTGLIPGKCLYTGDSPRRSDLHPCPRRLEHMEWIVSKWTSDDDLICDPFAGSGTTILAARLAQKRAVGIEISPQFYAKALENIRTNPTIFDKAAL